MKNWVRNALAIMASGLPTLVAAADDGLNLGRMTLGYTYYNRPGTDSVRHNADLAACLVDAAPMRSFEDQIGNPAGGILGGLLSGALADAANRGVISAALENCMVVRGWRVVRVDESEGKALAALPAAKLAARLAPWIGASAIHGTLVRSWHNDAALGAVNHFSLHAQHTRNGQLSLLALATSAAKVLNETRAVPRPGPEKIKLDPKWPTRAVKAPDLDDVTADATIIIVKINGISLDRGNGFRFSRIGQDPATPASASDHAPDGFAAIVGLLGASKDGNFLAFAVPPGRWRLFSSWKGGIELNFCLGSPAFEAKAGEVVYAGELDLRQDLLRPELSLEPVKAWLGNSRSAARLRPASYVNGTRSACAPNSIYALEFEGAPYEPGYALGSKASAPTTAP